jgi:hypothetical protein
VHNPSYDAKKIDKASKYMHAKKDKENRDQSKCHMSAVSWKASAWCELLAVDNLLAHTLQIGKEWSSF